MEKVGIRVCLVFIVLSLGLLFIDSRGGLLFIRNASSHLIKPVALVSAGIRENAADTIGFLTFWKSGEQRIKHLEEQNLALLVKATRAEALERENRQLREELGVENVASFKLLPAKVLGGGRKLLIGVGTNDGVSVGQTVAYKGALVGKIVRTSAKTSFVELPTDPDSKVPVVIGAVGTIRGLVTGQFNSSMILEQIVQTDKVGQNESIVTSGEEGGVEPGLLVGTAGPVLSKETDLFKKMDVKLPFDFGKLDLVFVILD